MLNGVALSVELYMIKNIIAKKWYVVCSPWGDGTWIRAGAPDAAGEYVVDCQPMINPEDGGLNEQQAAELAEYLVALHNKSMMHNAVLSGKPRTEL